MRSAAERTIETARREARPWADRAGLLGQLAHGVVYILLGLVALEAAVLGGAEPTGTPGVLAKVRNETLGEALLALLALGLASYAAWKLFQAVGRPMPRRARTVLSRAGDLGTSFIYASLVVMAVRMALGGGAATADDRAARDWTAFLLSTTLGATILALTAFGFIAVGGWLGWRGFTARLADGPDPAATPGAVRRWIIRFGRLGSYGRALALLLVGVFLLLALITADPGEARGLGGALRAVQHTAHGAWLLGAMGVGFVSAGLYDTLAVAYRPPRSRA